MAYATALSLAEPVTISYIIIGSRFIWFQFVYVTPTTSVF